MQSHCLLPYDERLRLVVAWLQQLEMESLGKSVAADGTVVSGRTGQAVWGASATKRSTLFISGCVTDAAARVLIWYGVKRPDTRTPITIWF